MSPAASCFTPTPVIPNIIHLHLPSRLQVTRAALNGHPHAFRNAPPPYSFPKMTSASRSPSSSGLLPMPGTPSSSWAVYRARLRAILSHSDLAVVVAFWLFGASSKKTPFTRALAFAAANRLPLQAS